MDWLLGGKSRMKINRRFVMNILLTLNGMGLGIFIFVKDWVAILGSLAIFLIILMDDYRYYALVSNEVKEK